MRSSGDDKSRGCGPILASCDLSRSFHLLEDKQWQMQEQQREQEQPPPHGRERSQRKRNVFPIIAISREVKNRNDKGRTSGMIEIWTSSRFGGKEIEKQSDDECCSDQFSHSNYSSEGIAGCFNEREDSNVEKVYKESTSKG
eukprot:5574513-Ditylum_brightwellii.AAC.1